MKSNKQITAENTFKEKFNSKEIESEVVASARGKNIIVSDSLRVVVYDYESNNVLRTYNKKEVKRK